MARTPNIDLREDYGRNYIINGSFDFWQRGTSLAGLTGAGTNYLADRFAFFRNTSATIRMDRSPDVPSQVQSSYSIKLECTSSGAVTTSNNLFYNMEGYDWIDIFNKTVTVSFWIKSAVAGDYGVCLRNTVDRSFVDTITVNTPNAWEQKTITIPGDNVGTYFFDNALGIQLGITFGNAVVGNEHGNLGGWESTNAVTSASQVDALSTAGNYVNIAEVQLTEGSEALPFRRAGRTIGEELRLCQRYFQKTWQQDVAVGTANTTGRKIIPAFMSSTTRIEEQRVELVTDMRVEVPQISFWSNNNTATRVSWTTRTGSSDVAIASVTRTTSRSFNVEVAAANGGARGDAALLNFHYTADAEL